MKNRADIAAVVAVSLIVSGASPIFADDERFSPRDTPQMAAVAVGVAVEAGVSKGKLSRGVGEIGRDRIGRLPQSERREAKNVIAAAVEGARAAGVRSKDIRVTYDPGNRTATVSLKAGASVDLAIKTNTIQDGTRVTFETPAGQSQKLTAVDGGGVKLRFTAESAGSKVASGVTLSPASFERNRGALVSLGVGGNVLPDKISTGQLITVSVAPLNTMGRTPIANRNDGAGPAAPVVFAALPTTARGGFAGAATPVDRGGGNRGRTVAPEVAPPTGATSQRAVTTPAQPLAAGPNLGVRPTVNTSLVRETIVTVQPGTIGRIPTTATGPEASKLTAYLGNFQAITGRAYVKEGPDTYVCRHFATDLARAINSDTKNPGYAAYYFSYVPVTETRSTFQKVVDFVRGDSGFQHDPSRGTTTPEARDGTGHAVNIIEAPYKNSSTVSQYFVVEPQKGKLLGSFIADQGKPTPPTWFVAAFLNSNFNKGYNFVEGAYAVRLHGSDLSHP